MSKGNSKALKKKVALEKDDYEGDSNDESEDSGDQFGWKQSKNRSNKNWLIGLHHYVPWSLISYTVKIIITWINILNASNWNTINLSVQQVQLGQHRIIQQ